jgi:hypothetical protein
VYRELGKKAKEKKGKGVLIKFINIIRLGKKKLNFRKKQ